MSDKKKQIIQEKVSIADETFDGPIYKVIERLDAYRTEFRNNQDPDIREPEMKFIPGWDNAEIEVVYWRYETDREFMYRMTQAERNEIEQREKDLAELKRLKEKYENE